MRHARFLVSALLALALPALGGCSLFGRSTLGETVTLEVNNNLALPMPVSIYVYSDVGSRQLIGAIEPDREAVLHFHAAHITGSYRFMAQVQRNAQLFSTPISLNGGETVSWELRNNIIRLEQQ
jgi:hypothetical protein